MKKPPQRNVPTSSKVAVDLISPGSDPRSEQSVRRPRAEVTVLDRTVREALSKQLHELMNSLWPAAARIELAISEETCPQAFRETLEQIGRCVHEAMTIAALASDLVDLPASEPAPP